MSTATGRPRERSVLRERDLVVIAVANFVSVTGDTAAIIALGLRLHAAGGGGWTIAALLLAGTVPLVFVSPVAGMWADRFDSRRMIATAVLVQAVCAAGLAVVDRTPVVLILLALLSSAGSVVGPATGALVPLVVGENRIAPANGVTQSAFVMGNLIGPAVGGALTGAFGSRAPLALDAVSFVVVAIGIACVRTRRGAATGRGDVDQPPTSGRRIIAADPVLLAVITVLAGLILVCGAVNVADIFLMKDALGTSDAIYGVVSACWMAGMMIGSWLTARFGSAESTLLAAMTSAVLVLAVGLVAAGAAPIWPVAAVAFVVGGIGNGMLTVASQTVIVRRTPEPARGRVLGVVTASINAGLVAAFVAGGALVAQVGSRPTVIGCGAAAGVVGVVFAAAMRGGRVRAPDTVPAWVSR